jgi:hypothetical protein
MPVNGWFCGLGGTGVDSLGNGGVSKAAVQIGIDKDRALFPSLILPRIVY